MNKVKSESTQPYEVSPVNNEEEFIIQQALDILKKRIVGSDPLTSPQLVRLYLVARVANKLDEYFGCLFLDNQHRVIKDEELFRGTIDGASVYPRVVVREALFCNAAAVIFYHNHPSGVPEPSDADKMITQRLKQALNLLDIRVLDHIIVGGATTYSFAEHGLL